MLTSFVYNFKQAFKQIGRNIGMSVASVVSITAMLLLLGLFFMGIVNINLAMEKAKQDYDEIQVYLLDDTPYEEAQSIMNDVQGLTGVKEVSYLSKEDAMESWKKEWGDSGYLLDSLSTNPLPNAIVIGVAELEYADGIAAKIEEYEGIEDVIYYQDTVEKLAKITHALQIATWIIMAFLVLVCIVVVSNTIRLTVFARAEEISIMKNVGATNWFIRGPFLLEGMIIGLLSALVSAGIATLVYSKIIEMVGNDIFLMFKMKLVPCDFLGMNLVWIFIALGIGVGACGSLVSMRRFLDT